MSGSVLMCRNWSLCAVVGNDEISSTIKRNLVAGFHLILLCVEQLSFPCADQFEQVEFIDMNCG